MNYSDELSVIWITPMRTATRTCGELQKIYNFDVSSHHGNNIPKNKSNYTLIFNIRNPYSRLVSLFRIFLHHTKEYSVKFEPWVKMVTDKDFKSNSSLMGYDFFLDKIINGLDKKPDYCVRVEFLEQDLKNLPFVRDNISNLDEYFKTQINYNGYENEFGDSNNWQSMYTQELADLIYSRREEEFKLFNYNKDYWKDGTP